MARHSARQLTGLSCLLVLSGCGAMQGTQINPTRMHMSEGSSFARWAQPSDPAVSSAKVASAEALPAIRYFDALEAAKRSPRGPNQQLVDYADAGIAVTQAHCLRWFQRLSDQGLVKDYADGNFNVLRQLGTTLLGIGGAADAVVTFYGAINTAYEGASKNYEDTFLIAPTSRKVKQQIMNLLETQATDLRLASAKENFDQIYIRLERYADLCTHTTAREIVNAALDQGVAKIADNGKLQVEPNPERVNDAAAQARVSAEQARRQAQDALVEERLNTTRLRDELAVVRGQLDKALKAYSMVLTPATNAASQPQ